MLRQFFRPSILIALSAAVVVGAVVVVFQGPPAQGRPAPLPVRDGEFEIVWLYPATSAASWERFVAAVRRTAERMQRSHPEVRADDKSAFPQQTAAVPQVSLSASGSGPHFLFRWYKLTGDWKTGDWVEALLARRPPPLAIIGGNSSDSARELAIYLRRFTEELQLSTADRPLLLFTTATADRVIRDRAAEADQLAATEANTIALTQLYPERTFRFCFSNRQMALAVSDFIWQRDDLRPTRDPVHLAMWNDDSYSRDLIDGFENALRQVMVRDFTNQWTWTINQLLVNSPAGLAGGIFPVQRLPTDPSDERSASTFCLEKLPAPQRIDSSVGGFDTPNAYEAKASGAMLDALLSHSQSRPLLIVAGQVQPSRRFLRGLVRGMPSLSKRAQIVVASGDAIAFNTVYRDRQVSWNIQDLPFPLVFFCHRNPIDAGAGFRAGDVLTSATAPPRQEPRICCYLATSWKHWCRPALRWRERRALMPRNWPIASSEYGRRTSGSFLAEQACRCSTARASAAAAQANISFVCNRCGMRILRIVYCRVRPSKYGSGGPVMGSAANIGSDAANR